MKIIWYGHACFWIEMRGVKILIDPYEYVNDDAIDGVDYILVTHEHSDHYGKTPLLARLRDATVIGPKTVYLMAISDGITKVREIRGGEEIELENNVRVKAIFVEHPSSQYPLGYLISNGKKTIFHPGDTYYTPIFKNLRGEVDVLFVPISGRSTANVREAANIVEIMRPKITIPMHYGAYSEADPNKLINELREKRVWTLVKVLEIGKPFEI
ncbi:MBL fold metallo-hydrolase [Thermococcus sp. MV5]|uniref:MBL fold metallo-hydrolase n=1 Tax=Thermococcus sp. MV5 TaxID=1638272 RepID=UPI00143C0274|nr:MBL fold metallo-hydrolase [Thermococcus sp. MV5]NJE25989.1 MBL fold metallo-hydrolase [Thermococcus sp. MV5]